MADEQKNIRRIVAPTRTELQQELSERMLGFETQTGSIGAKKLAGDMSWFTPEHGDAVFNSIINEELAGNGNSDIGVDDNGKIVIRSASGGAIDYQDFTPQTTPPSYLEGRVWYDDFAQTLKVHNDLGTNIEMGRTLSSPFTAEEDISKGDVLYASMLVSPGVYGVKKATADSYNENWVFGVASNDALTGEVCEFMQQGYIFDVDTSLLTESVPLYMDVVRGQITNDRPQFPAEPIILGAVLAKDAVNGILGINMSRDNYDVTYDGCIIEKHNTNIVVDGTSVYMDVSNLDDITRDLPIQLASAIYELDTTTGTGTTPIGSARVELTQGTSTTPQGQLVYIDLTGGVATLKTTVGYPSSPFAPVANVSIRDYTTVSTEGADSHRRLTSAKSHDGRGRISYLTERFAVESPIWYSGVTPTATIDNTPTPDVLDLEVIAGIVYQTHRQDFPALSVSTDGIYVANAENTPTISNYQKFNNLIDLCGYTSENIGRDTSSRGHLVIFGCVNKSTQECKLYVNLPNELYGGSDSSAFYDPDSTANFTVPDVLRSTAFLIAQIQYDIANTNNVDFLDPTGGTTTNGEYVINLLGNPIGVSGGATGGGTFIPNLTQVLAQGNDGGGSIITNIDTPVNDSDVATKKYVDDNVVTPNLTQVLAQGNDGGGAQLKNIADGTNAQDAVSMSQLDSVVLSSPSLVEMQAHIDRGVTVFYCGGVGDLPGGTLNMNSSNYFFFSGGGSPYDFSMSANLNFVFPATPISPCGITFEHLTLIGVTGHLEVENNQTETVIRKLSVTGGDVSVTAGVNGEGIILVEVLELNGVNDIKETTIDTELVYQEKFSGGVIYNYNDVDVTGARQSNWYSPTTGTGSESVGGLNSFNVSDGSGGWNNAEDLYYNSTSKSLQAWLSFGVGGSNIHEYGSDGIHSTHKASGGSTTPYSEWDIVNGNIRYSYKENSNNDVIFDTSLNFNTSTGLEVYDYINSGYGTIKVGVPVDDNDASTKKYVDDNMSNDVVVTTETDLSAGVYIETGVYETPTSSTLTHSPISNSYKCIVFVVRTGIHLSQRIISVDSATEYDNYQRAGSYTTLPSWNRFLSQTEGTFEADLTGFASTVTATINYKISTDRVELHFVDDVYALSNTSAMGISNIPPEITPISTQVASLPVIGGVSSIIGQVTVSSIGTIEFSTDGMFTSSGLKGYQRQTIIYYLN